MKIETCDLRLKKRRIGEYTRHPPASRLRPSACAAPRTRPPRCRCAAGVVYASKFALAAVTCLTWPLLRRTVGRRALYCSYGGIALLCGAYLAWRLPETKGRRLGDIWLDLH